MYSVYVMKNKNSELDKVIIYGQDDFVQERINSLFSQYTGTGHTGLDSEKEAFNKAIAIAEESPAPIVLVDDDLF
jgi:hypothetical protein